MFHERNTRDNAHNILLGEIIILTFKKKKKN